jgi:hypothetical protein
VDFAAVRRGARGQPGFGKVLVGRGAVNQKGPQAAFLRRCTRCAAPAASRR